MLGIRTDEVPASSVEYVVALHQPTFDKKSVLSQQVKNIVLGARNSVSVQMDLDLTCLHLQKELTVFSRYS